MNFTHGEIGVLLKAVAEEMIDCNVCAGAAWANDTGIGKRIMRTGLVDPLRVDALTELELSEAIEIVNLD